MTMPQGLPEGVKPLSLEEARNLVSLLNFYNERLPRVVGTLLANEVQTDLGEIQSAFGPMPIWPARGLDLDYIKIPGMHRFSQYGGSAMNVADLLTAICDSRVRVTMTYENGRPKLVAGIGF